MAKKPKKTNKNKIMKKAKVVQGAKGKRTSKSAKIISFGNMKGGVGKTVGAINIAAELGEMGYSVLLIDCDYQSNATHNMGVFEEGIRSRKTLYEGLVTGVRKMSQCIIDTDFKNVKMIASRFELFDFSFSNNVVRMNTDFRDWLRQKDLNQFDYVILDSRPEISHLFINVMVASDFVIIPILCEAESIFGLSIILNHLSRIQKSRKEFRLLGVYFSNYDKTISTHRDNKKFLEEFLPSKKVNIVGTVPFSKAAKKSTEMLKPLIYSHPSKNLPIHLAFKELALRIAELTTGITGRAPLIPQIDVIESEQAYLNIADSIKTKVVDSGFDDELNIE